MVAKFVVTFEAPPGVSAERLRRYVKDAVQTMCKAAQPDDPLFDLKARTVKVETARDEKPVP
jgi:hypothetical protein